MHRSCHCYTLRVTIGSRILSTRYVDVYLSPKVSWAGPKQHHNPNHNHTGIRNDLIIDIAKEARHCHHRHHASERVYPCY